VQTETVDLSTALGLLGQAWHPEVGQAFNVLCTSAVRMRFKQNLFFLLKRPGMGPDDPKEIHEALRELTNLSGGVVEQIMHGVITPAYVGYVARRLQADGYQMLTENFWENPFFQKAREVA